MPRRSSRCRYALRHYLAAVIRARYAAMAVSRTRCFDVTRLIRRHISAMRARAMKAGTRAMRCRHEARHSD